MRWIAGLAMASGLALTAADLSAPCLGSAHPVAAVARLALAPTCHQLPERSFRAAGETLPACTRCTGLHASGLLGGLLALLLPAAIVARLPAPRLLVLVGLAPMAADVAAGLFLDGWDHPWLRAATGLVAGTALLLTLRAGGGDSR